jgi:hypothetical protein
MPPQPSRLKADHEQGEAAPSLASLPSCVLSQIAEHSKEQDFGFPRLLGVASCGRDAVLGNLKQLCLAHGPQTLYVPGATNPPALDATPGPVARLLHRACTQAPAGLKVTLHVNKDLLELLKFGVESGGWDRVHTLEVRQQRQPVAC